MYRYGKWCWTLRHAHWWIFKGVSKPYPKVLPFKSVVDHEYLSTFHTTFLDVGWGCTEISVSLWTTSPIMHTDVFVTIEGYRWYIGEISFGVRQYEGQEQMASDKLKHDSLFWKIWIFNPLKYYNFDSIGTAVELVGGFVYPILRHFFGINTCLNASRYLVLSAVKMKGLTAELT